MVPCVFIICTMPVITMAPTTLRTLKATMVSSRLNPDCLLSVIAVLALERKSLHRHDRRLWRRAIPDCPLGLNQHADLFHLVCSRRYGYLPNPNVFPGAIRHRAAGSIQVIHVTRGR